MATLDTTKQVLTTGFNVLGTVAGVAVAPIKYTFQSIQDHYASKRESRDRIAVAAFMNAASTDEEDLRKWFRKARETEMLETHNNGNNVKFTEDDMIAHLGKMRRRDKKALKALRETHIRDEAQQYFEQHGKVEDREAPKARENREVSLKNPLDAIAEGFGRASNALRQSSFEKEGLQLEQSERLLAMAFRDVKERPTEGGTRSAIKNWLNEANKNGTLELFIPEGEKLNVNTRDVMKHLDNIEPEHRAELVAAGKEYRKEEKVAARSNQAYEAFRPDNILA